MHQAKLVDLLQAAEELARLGHWSLDLPDQQLHWSDEVFRIHGFEPGTFTPSVEQAIGFFHPQDQADVRNTFLQSLKDGRAWQAEWRLIDAQGQERTILARGRPLQENGLTIALFGVILDITEQKRQQQLTEQLSKVVELSQEGILITDPQGRIIWANKGFEAMSGYALAEMLGQKPGHLLQGPDTDPMAVAYMSKKLQEQEPFSTEILNYHKDGHRYWLKINVYPQFDEQGQLKAFMAIETDISSGKRAQQQLEEQAHALHKEIRRRELLEEELRELAYHDPLTGLYNRRYFFEQFEKEYARAQRYSDQLSLILLDIDHFKQINDRYGHDNGDQVLCEVAELVKQAVRDSDLPARVGGEEFAILAVGCDCEAARQLAERICQRIGQYSFHLSDESHVRVTVSLGLTTLTHERDEGCKAAYQRADRALYAAKHGGRNRVQLDVDDSNVYA